MKALILGVLGQDGSYLAEQLAADGVEVFGMTRRTTIASSVATLVYGDLLDQESLERVLRRVRPDEVYNLAAVTAPGMGWRQDQQPMLADVTGLGVVRLLNAMLRAAPDARLVHASSSAVREPRRYGLYGAAKVLAHEAVIGHRDRLHCSNAIFYSHTSPRQDSRFLAPRICSTIARIAKGSGETLTLGDVDSRRDWGWAPDHCRALPLIARLDRPADVVVASGTAHSVRDLTEAALTAAGLRWDDVVRIDPALPEVPHETHPRSHPGWPPRVVVPDRKPLVDMAWEMVHAA